MANDHTVKKVIDAYLQAWIDAGINKLPSEIEREMSDPNQDPEEEWRIWLPINSKVTDTEIESFEEQLGYKLPADYKVFLKHKHFYELHISEATFCGHPVNEWRAHLEKMIFNSWPTEELIDKGYIPFADWNDWGTLF